ncbi:hypothetical protein ACF08M_37440 [Streptomyces sp. NPDC015032]|uniref:hypothetical protein n=1 Tax=Streptomyces sp. NPDC015032 TaxID=3364937 RepID=UPI00370274C1
MKAAAATWLHGRGEQARFDFAQSDGVPVGSVVDIHWRHGGLRVHLDQAVAPAWGEDRGVRTAHGVVRPGRVRVTERGLSTPAVERIVQVRSVPPPAKWATGKARKGPDTDARARGLLRRLADARKVESVVVVTRVCREIADLAGASQETQGELDAAVQGKGARPRRVEPL